MLHAVGERLPVREARLYALQCGHLVLLLPHSVCGSALYACGGTCADIRLYYPAQNSAAKAQKHMARGRGGALSDRRAIHLLLYRPCAPYGREELGFERAGRILHHYRRVLYIPHRKIQPYKTFGLRAGIRRSAYNEPRRTGLYVHLCGRGTHHYERAFGGDGGGLC